MHTIRKGHGALALVLSLVCSLAIGGVAALAAAGWVESGGDNTLTVAATGSEDKDFADDVATANVVVDVYRIGSATEVQGISTYTYSVDEEGFEGLFDDEDKSIPASFTTDDWTQLAADAAKRVTADTEHKTANAGTAVTGLPDGVYLVLAHGSNVTPEYGADIASSLMAYSATHSYTFAPTLVTLPYKDTAHEDGSMSTDYGEWTKEGAIAMKPKQGDLFGSLIINKTVQGAVAPQATFVYHIVDTATGGEVYDNYASVYCTSDTGSTEVTHIPANIEVEVTEVYPNSNPDPDEAVGRFVYVSGNGTRTIVSDEAVALGADKASIDFVNKPSGGHPDGGHGVENKFTFVDYGVTWDGPKATPESALVKSTEEAN